MEHTQIATTHREAFMRAVEKEMAKFERDKSEFRKRDRDEREAALWAARADDYSVTY